MFVQHFFELDKETVEELRGMVPEFGYNGFGEFLFYRTYSRRICDKCRKLLKYNKEECKDYCRDCGYDFTIGQENWADVVIRNINGTFSIRKDWYIKNHILWEEDVWQHYARHMAISMFKMEWSPPGRGLWAMGTDFIYERGSMALNNCGYTEITDEIGKDVNWVMDALMMGVGVGFDPLPSDNFKTYVPVGEYDYKISDDREGWCDATQVRIDCYLSPRLPKPRFIYDGIRKANLPIRGFGGVSSGPEPLIYLHKQIDKFFEMYRTLDWYTVIHLKADIVNAVGCCVIAGNVRRSAELLKGKYKDVAELKNYERYPYREEFGGMSNNSISLETDEDFDYLIDISESIKINAEPGAINLRNFPFGRIGKKMKGLRLDRATGINPCGEQLLENKELCTLAITYPTKCKFDDINQWLKACEYATMYACTVTLLPTHRPETNAVMLRNRRIGVDITDVSLWKHEIGITNLVKNLRKGYKRVRATGKWANSEAGVPEPIRFTTIKPGGTGPKLPGVRSGWQNPTFGYTLRRVRCPQNQNIFDILHRANVPHEPDVFSKNTEVFEFAIDQSAEGRVKPATEVSIWEQAMMLVLLQREWSDNAVSNTIYFQPKWNLVKDFNLKDSIYYDELEQPVLDYLLNETSVSYADIFERREHESKEHKVKLEQDNYTDDWHLKIWKFDPNHEEDAIEGVLAAIAPLTKSVSVLPHSTVGAYRQMPEEGLTKEEYEERLSRIRKIDWTKYRGSDGIDEKFCEGPSCTILPG